MYLRPMHAHPSFSCLSHRASGLVRAHILTCMNAIHTSFRHWDGMLESPVQERWSLWNVHLSNYFLFIYFFSMCVCYCYVPRRKCSNGSVFPGEPSGPDDPLWQVGEQEGDWLFVHLQGRTGRATAWGGSFSCQGEEGKVAWRHKTHSTSGRQLDLSIFVHQEDSLTQLFQTF